MIVSATVAKMIKITNKSWQVWYLTFIFMRTEEYLEGLMKAAFRTEFVCRDGSNLHLLLQFHFKNGCFRQYWKPLNNLAIFLAYKNKKCERSG